MFFEIQGTFLKNLNIKDSVEKRNEGCVKQTKQKPADMAKALSHGA